MKVFKSIIVGMSIFWMILILPQVGFYILGVPLELGVKEASQLVYIAIILGFGAAIMTIIALHDNT